MTREQIALMVAGTKETKDGIGQRAWLAPYGKCTNNFNHAVNLWADFFASYGF